MTEMEDDKLSGDSPRPQESKVSIARAAQLFRKLDVCSSLSAKLILLRNFCERYAAELREAEAPRKPSEDLVHELGFEVKREDGDVLIRDSDDLEWTSGKVWARSAPETVVTMLADLWKYARKRVPIKIARLACEAAECRQVILCAWDGELTHIVTYGKTTEDCAQAAQGGNYLKQKWGWPECNDQPSRVKKLEASLAEAKKRIIELEAVQPEPRK